jgi:UDP-N-acetyl-D-galactosamine dehydrogenase
LVIPEEARHYCGIELVELSDIRNVDAVVLAVAHSAFKDLGLMRIAGFCRKDCSIIIDIKSLFEPELARELGIKYWRL